MSGYNEIYITMCFSVCINTSATNFDSPSVIINQVFAIASAAVLVYVPYKLMRTLIKAWKEIKSIDQLDERKEGGSREEH